MLAIIMVILIIHRSLNFLGREGGMHLPLTLLHFHSLLSK